MEHWSIEDAILRPSDNSVTGPLVTKAAEENSYDSVPYPKVSHRQTHPRQLEAA